jgi:hypothetical protein
MAVTPKIFSRAAAATSSTTLYTTPSATTAILTQITVSNTSSGSLTFSILLDDVALFNTVSIAANTTTTYSTKQVLTATKTIKGSASATDVNFHLTGVEIA